MAGKSIGQMMGYPEPYNTANPNLPEPSVSPNQNGVPALGLSDTKALPANEPNLDQNLAIQRANQAASDKMWNYQRKSAMEAAGQQHYTDAFGNIQPVLDQATGKPLFKEQDYVDYDEKGNPYRRQVDKFGNQQISDPDANAKRSSVSNDPGTLYKENNYKPWEQLGNAYDIAKQSGWDQATADAAKSVSDNGRNEVSSAANEGINKLKAKGELDLETAKQREQQLQASTAELSKQQDAITSNPAYTQTSGGFLGIGAKPTDQAAKLKSQNDAIQSQIDTLSQQQQQATQDRMKAEAEDKKTKLEAQMLENTNKLNGYEAVEQKRRQALISQGKSSDEIEADPVLDTIQKKKDEVGLTKSKVEQQHQIITQAGDAAQRTFMKDPATQDDINSLDQMLKKHQDSFQQLNAKEQGLQAKLQDGTFTSSDERQAIISQLQDVHDEMHHAGAEANAIEQVRGQAVNSLHNNNGVIQPQPGKREFTINVDPNKFSLNFSANRIPDENSTTTSIQASQPSQTSSPTPIATPASSASVPSQQSQPTPQVPESTPKREVGFWEGLGRGITEGASKTNQMMIDAATIMPYLSQKAAEAVGSDAKPYDWAVQQIKNFQNKTGIGQPGVDASAIKPTEQLSNLGTVGHGLGTMAADLPLMAATGGASAEAQGAKLLGDEAPTILQAIKDSAPHFEHGLKAMSIPAARAGSEQIKQAQEQGADTTSAVAKGIATAVATDLTGVIPMSATSGRVLLKDSSTTANLVNGTARFLERGVIGWLAGIPIGEAQKVVQSWIDGKPYVPEDLKSMVLDAAPMALMSGALGGSTAKEQPSSVESARFDKSQPDINAYNQNGGTQNFVGDLNNHYSNVATTEQPGLNKQKQYGADVKTAQNLNSNLPEGSQPYTPEQIALARQINPTPAPDLAGTQRQLAQLDAQIADAQARGQKSQGRGVEDGINHPQNLSLANSDLQDALQQRAQILNSEVAKAQDAGQKSDLALKAAQEIHSLPDQGDQTIATGLAKLGNGQPIEHLTGEERDSLLKPRVSADPTTGQATQTPPLVRIEQGKPIITDAATRWMEGKAPTAAQMIPLDETGQLRNIYPEGVPTKPESTPESKQPTPDESFAPQQQPSTPNGASTESGSTEQGQQPVGSARSGEQGTEGNIEGSGSDVGTSPVSERDDSGLREARARVAQRIEANARNTNFTNASDRVKIHADIFRNLEKVSNDLGIKVEQSGADELKKEGGLGGARTAFDKDGNITIKYNPVVSQNAALKGQGRSIYGGATYDGDSIEYAHAVAAQEIGHAGWLLNAKQEWLNLPETSRGNFDDYVNKRSFDVFDGMHKDLNNLGDTDLGKDFAKAIIGSWNSYHTDGNRIVSSKDDVAHKNALQILEQLSEKPEGSRNPFVFVNELGRQLAEMRVTGRITENAEAGNFIQKVYRFLRDALAGLKKVSENTSQYSPALDQMVTASSDYMAKMINLTHPEAVDQGKNVSIKEGKVRPTSAEEAKPSQESPHLVTFHDGSSTKWILEPKGKENKVTLVDYDGKKAVDFKSAIDAQEWARRNPDVEKHTPEIIEKMLGNEAIPAKASKKIAPALYNAIENGKWTDYLLPENKISRSIFTRISGLKLPTTQSGSKEAFDQWVSKKNEQVPEKTPENAVLEQPVTRNIKPEEPKPLSEGDKALKEFADGLDSREPIAVNQEEETFDKGLPPDKIIGGLQVAQKLLDEGIKTPEAFAAKLHEISPEKLPKYSKAIWSLLRAVDTSLDDVTDWKTHFDNARKPKEPIETPKSTEIRQNIDSESTQDTSTEGDTIKNNSILDRFTDARQVDDWVKKQSAFIRKNYIASLKDSQIKATKTWGEGRKIELKINSAKTRTEEAVNDLLNQWNETMSSGMHLVAYMDRKKMVEKMALERIAEINEQNKPLPQHPEPATPGNRSGDIHDWHGPQISNYEHLILPSKNALNNAEIEVGQRPNGNWVTKTSYNTSMRGGSGPFNTTSDTEYPTRNEAVQASVNGLRKVAQRIFDEERTSGAERKDVVRIWQFLNQHDPSGPKELKKTEYTPEQIKDQKHRELIMKSADLAEEASRGGDSFQVKDLIDNQGIAEQGGIKKVQESIEAGIVMAAKDIVHSQEDDEAYKSLIDLYKNQPTLGAQTSTSKINQAYSTPAPLAYVADKLADLANGFRVYEPSAGHGMLLIDSNFGQIIHFNELDPNRVDNYVKSGMPNPHTRVTSEDATEFSPKVATGMDENDKVDRVITNAPFGSVMGEDGKAKVFKTPFGETTQIDHAINAKALESLITDEEAEAKKNHSARSQFQDRKMQPVVDNRDYRGRATLIIGGPPKQLSDEARQSYYAGGQRGAFFKYLYDNYGVVDHFTVNGDLYKKQGAGWPVDVITLVGTKPSEIALPSYKAPRIINTWDDLWKTTQLTDEQRIQQNRITEDDLRSKVGDMVGRLSGLSKPRGENIPGQEPVGNPERNTGSERNNAPRTPSEPVSGQIQSGGQEPVSGMDVGSSGQDEFGRSGGSDEQSGNNSRGEGEQSGGVRPSTDNPPRPGNELTPDADQFQVAYEPFSKVKGVDTLIPTNMASAAKEAFAKMEEQYGDLGKWVHSELGYKDGEDISKYLSGEQVDGVAAAIHNFKNDGALIIGDQTGIGKGRIAAALMRWAEKNGLIPVFITKDRTLQSDMLTRDLVDVGAEHIVPALLDSSRDFDAAKDRKLNYGESYWKEATKNGKLHNGANAIFTTYDQLKSDTDRKAAPTKVAMRMVMDGQAPPGKWRTEALKAFGPKAVFILDESHLAAGKSTIGYRMRDLLNNAKHAYYSSATAIKRPETMGVYFKTALGKMAGGMDGLVDLMNHGGVPAMQIASQMLARAGQYLRRERSFEGIKFNTHITEENLERDAKLADNLTESLRTIMGVQDKMKQAANAINGVISQQAKRFSAEKGSNIAMDSDFASQLHNVVSQYLLAIKADAAAEQAIQEMRQGKKVVVTVQNTMEGIVEDLKNGGYDMSYKGITQKYLDGMLTFKTGKKNANDEHEKFTITGVPDPEFASLSDNQLAQAIVKKGVLPDGTKVVEADPKAAQELMRRKMWDVHQDARAEIDQADLGDLPISPIDYIRSKVEKSGNNFATDEITGRKSRLDEYNEIYSRPDHEQKTSIHKGNVIKAFNNSPLNFVILNQSGSTGVSLHASETAKDQSPRVMIVAQPHQDINEFMQTLGRINRTGQVRLPEYTLLQTALPAEKRPAAILASKMAKLNANTTSNAKSDVSEGIKNTDIYNKYGDEIAFRFLMKDKDLANQLFNLGGSLKKNFFSDDGEIKSFDDIKSAMEEHPDGHTARMITSYLAVLPVEEQQNFWDKVTDEYNAHISYLNELGQNDLEAKPMDIKAKTTASEVFTHAGDGDSVFSDPSYLETVHAEMGKKPISGDEAATLATNKRATSSNDLQNYEKMARDFYTEAEQVKAKRSLNWTDEKKESFLAQQRQMASTVATGMRMMGRILSYTRPDGSEGLAVIESVDLDKSSPITPSKQIFTIRTNDTTNTLKVPASQIDKFQIAIGSGAREWDATADVSNTRNIVTGNLLAALAELRGTGQVINYTTDSGESKMGILLPNNFTKIRATQDLNRQPINDFQSFVKAQDYDIQNGDKTLTITSDPIQSQVRFVQVPQSKASGGKYWQNPVFNKFFAGGEMVRKGNFMRGSLLPGKLEDFYKFLSDNGEKLSYTPIKGKPQGLDSREPLSPEEKMQAIRDKMAGRTQENLGKLSWDNEDLTHDNTENSTENRTPSALPREITSADLEQGGVGQAIPAERAFVEITGGKTPEYAGVVSDNRVIGDHDKALIDWAKENNRIIPQDAIDEFSKDKNNAGQTEHHVWKITGSDGTQRLVKATANGKYGFPGKSAFQYLRRLDEFSREVPSAKVDFLGISQDPKTGKPSIWTSQPYLEGLHPTGNDLPEYLKTQGWEPFAGDYGYGQYKHGDTGILMRDAHEGNFIKRPDGKIVPFDVMFKGINDRPTPPDQSGRNTLFARNPLNPEGSDLKGDVENAMRDISDWQNLAKAEKSGSRTIGNPKLGLGALDPQIMGVDEYRKTIATKQKESQWSAEGKNLLDNDYAGTRQRIMDAGMNGGTLNPAETKAAQMMVARELAGASTDSAKRAELAKLIYAYRQTGTEQARGLRSRVDPFQSPADRHREFLAKMIFSPSPEESRRIDAIEDAAEKSNALSKIVDAQMESAKKALESMGVSLDDILNGEVKVSLIGSKVSENLIGSFRPNEQTAIRLLQKGKTFENTAKATGLSVKQVENLKKQFQDSFRSRHFAKFEKGMSASDIEQPPSGLNSRSPINLDKAESEFQKALELMGMGEDAGLAKKKPNRTFNIADPVDAIKLGRTISASNGNALNMVHEYWMSSILSGMVTHAANFTGMGVNGAIDYTIQRGMEALVNSAIGNPEGTQMGEFKYIMKGIVPGVSNAVRAGLRAWDAEQSMIDYDLLGHNLKLDQGQIVGHASSGAIPGKAGRIIRMPMRALAFMDDAVKTIIAHMEVGAQAYRSAKAEGYEGDEMAKYIQSEITTPGSQSWERAVSHAVNLAFQTPLRNMDESGGNIVEAGAEALQRGLRGYTPGRFFIPFVRVLYNIPRVGIRKSPIGTATMLYKMGREGFYKFQDGKLNPHPYAGAEMIRDTSEQILAWSLMAALWGAAAGDQDDDKKKILFTGSSESHNKGDKALSERLGVPAYHIKVNGTTYNYGRIEPIATVLGTTLDMIRAAKSARDGASGKEILGQVFGGIWNQFQEKSFGKGLKDIAGVTSDPQNAADWAANFAASFVPNLLRQPIRASDPYVRETSVEGNPKELIPRIAQRVGQSALPFGSLNEPRIDLYGNPIKKEGTMVSRLTPMQGREVPKVEPADRLFANWNAKHPDEAFAPDKPTRRYVDPVTGKVHYMDDKMFRKYSELAGKAFQQATRAAITPQMAKNPTEEDHKLVHKILEQSRKDAKQQVLSSMRPKTKSIQQMLFGN